MTERSWPKGLRTSDVVKMVLGLAVVFMAIFLIVSGARGGLDAHAVHARIRALGPLGPIAFVLAFALVQPLGPSGHIFTVAASLLWPSPIAFAIGLVGAVASQIVAFLFYRHVAFDWARARIPAVLARYEAKLVERPFLSILALRAVLFTWPLVAAMLGVSRVRFLPMLAGTILGLVPPVALDVWLGTELFGFLLPGGLSK